MVHAKGGLKLTNVIDLSLTPQRPGFSSLQRRTSCFVFLSCVLTISLKTKNTRSNLLKTTGILQNKLVSFQWKRNADRWKEVQARGLIILHFFRTVGTSFPLETDWKHPQAYIDYPPLYF